MTAKPPHLRPEFAERFKDPGVADAYLSRPPYPPETFQILSGLLCDTDRRVLDVGCGTGAIARNLAPLVQAIDAVDFSSAMIEAAKALPGGGRANITWIVGKAEEVKLNPPYGLVVGGQSIHWMDWDVVLPRFRRMLGQDGLLAVVDLETVSPWDEELRAIINRFSTNRDYVPYDMVSAWRNWGLFEEKGRKTSGRVPIEQEMREYLSFLHSMSSLTSASMGAERAHAFDDEVQRMLSSHSVAKVVGFDVYSSVVWGTLTSSEVK